MKLADIDRCTGCGACAAVCPRQCIQMLPDAEGFLCPVVDQGLCVDCGLCSGVCPVLTPPDPCDHPTTAFAAINKDTETRLQSTSGGVFALLSRWILDRGGVVFGAAYTGTFAVEHRMITSPEELPALQSAKYAQSVLADSFRTVRTLLENGRYVLFSGTPCQIAGLRAFLRKDYERLLLVDLICHGVPSPSVWACYLNYRSKTDAEEARPISVNLRSKDTGWPGYSVKIQYENGVNYLKKNMDDPFIRSFVGNLSLRPSCYACSCKGIERSSDFTLGDYWGVWSQLPAYNDGQGTSLVLIHSDRGNAVWNDIAGALTAEQVELPHCLEENPSALCPSPLPGTRAEFLARYRDEDFEALTDRLLPRPAPAPRSLFRRVKGKVGRMLRKLQNP